MLEKLRNKRVVFAGDSISRNHRESLLCMLSTAVSNKSSIYEVNGNPITKHNGCLVFKYEDFNSTVEYFRSPRWTDADLVIFSAGRWWTYEKTLREGYYFQEGDKVQMNMSVKRRIPKIDQDDG
ncbi:hypothetical protein TIFTF001_017941 [Ficus carica]|uniref:Trichome birefringence-like C-terminal domain-containing protein n=1 Tax=Ficus carica TaxID=3494 RepID=A0AA88DB82_FICCA|nr:hypothetical protein TIFTF001_017941 [Ficus carica]